MRGRDRVLETLHERDGIDFAQNVSVRSGALGSDAPLLGAAEVAFGPLLERPGQRDDRLSQRPGATAGPADGAAHSGSHPHSPGAA